MSKRKTKVKTVAEPPKWPTLGYSRPEELEQVVINLEPMVKNKRARQIQIRLRYQGAVHVVTLTRNDPVWPY